MRPLHIYHCVMLILDNLLIVDCWNRFLKKENVQQLS